MEDTKASTDKDEYGHLLGTDMQEHLDNEAGETRWTKKSFLSRHTQSDF